MHGFLVHHSFICFLFVLLQDFRSCTGLVSRDKIPQVVTRFYLSPDSPPTFEVVLARFGSFHIYLPDREASLISYLTGRLA